MLKGNTLLTQRIENYLSDLIDNGSLHTGDRLLPEREIAKLFNASTKPVRNAMQKFIDQGVLEKVHGKGTFVRKVTSRSKQSDRLAILHCHSREGFFGSTFYTSIIAGVEAGAHQVHKALVMQSLFREDGVDPSDTFRLLEQDTDGLILIDPFPDLYFQLEPCIRQSTKPVVILNAEYATSDFDYILTDSRENTRQLTELLISLGHTRIACLYKKEKGRVHPNFANRVAAYKDTMEGHGLPIPDEMVVGFSDQGTCDRVRGLLDSKNRPTGIVCTGGHIASHLVYPEVLKLGMSIPDDVSVVSYDDDLLSLTLNPHVTVMDTGLRKMGQLGVKRILEKQEEKERGEETHYRVVLPGKLLLRDSHKALKR